uniref:Uncharacterized protein n=1 Tax=viral metagenome TaxID=1070528 RepID=A0A6C0CVC1_9ZZZZ
MFSVVIKNSILMLLLILIIHFMIINYISDIQNQYNSMKESTPTNEVNTITKVLHQPTDYSLSPNDDIVVDHDESLSSQDATQTKSFTSIDKLEEDCKVHDDQQELYDFVYGDKKAEGELNMLYKEELKPCDIESDKIVDCTPNENKGDTISFCKNNVDQHFENKNLERLQQDTEDVTKSGHPIVFKYNESKKDLLDGFESFGSSFMLLKN